MYRLLFLVTSASGFVQNDSTINKPSFNLKVPHKLSRHHQKECPSRSNNVAMNALFESGVDPAIATMVLSTALISALAVKEGFVSEEIVNRDPVKPYVSSRVDIDKMEDLGANVAVEGGDLEEEKDGAPNPMAAFFSEDILEYMEEMSDGTQRTVDKKGVSSSVTSEENEAISALQSELERIDKVFTRDESVALPDIKKGVAVGPPEDKKKKSSLIGKVAKKTIMPWKSFRNL
mmetsp:Transcript_29700/g.45434  ORF Transcript_29700/g.45434 Transcript_29700/m.45434 type:complete len:233 (+) Transcript_29700:213-911(+)|eukprot:CAMPEP_0194088102 /NCGR_PEP_ID=MMETSP0149-20130528/27847_1 /TAXON_ID=122233 /ORGANISM="Chaetoceros debilis, Strain MM31A-1" /LENGTH=232 /DNA_ID=CAMNT_0038771681 /DNA_START=238 /DNA_END=936 /DNA_ORIENTATION=+